MTADWDGAMPEAALLDVDCGLEYWIRYIMTHSDHDSCIVTDGDDLVERIPLSDEASPTCPFLVGTPVF